MIYQLIRDFTNLRIAYFNQAKTELVDLNENVQWLDVDNLPNNASDIYYNFKISDYENDDKIDGNYYGIDIRRHDKKYLSNNRLMDYGRQCCDGVSL